MKFLKAVLLVVIFSLHTPALACPFCNVDGPATRAFILSVFGTAILGGVLILFWSILSGHYHDVEAPKHRILQLDEETEVSLSGKTGNQSASHTFPEANDE